MPVEPTVLDSPSSSAPSMSSTTGNCYTTVAALKTKLNYSGSTHDAELLDLLRAVSRDVDGVAGRHFYVERGTRYFDACRTDRAMIDDCLGVTSLTADSELDGTFDGETWEEGADFEMGPYNHWPKTRIDVLPYGDYTFQRSSRYLKIVGMWGYGDGFSASPWAALDLTGTVASTTGTALTLAGGGEVAAGQTLLVGDEQVFVTAVSGSTATVSRGMNGTTAAIHAGDTVALAQYPADVVKTTLWFALESWRAAMAAGYSAERIGDWSYTLADDEKLCALKMRQLSRVTRTAI